MIWVASPRVGASTFRPAARAALVVRQSRDERNREGERLAAAGLAAAQTSRPARVSGSVAAWIGKGEVRPAAVSACTRVRARRGRRRYLRGHAWPFRLRVYTACDGVAMAQLQHRWARLPGQCRSPRDVLCCRGTRSFELGTSAPEDPGRRRGVKAFHDVPATLS